MEKIIFEKYGTVPPDGLDVGCQGNQKWSNTYGKRQNNK